MKTFFTRLSIAFFTFLAGITFTSVFVFFTQLPEIKEVSDNFNSVSIDTCKFSDNKIQIQYNGTSIENFISFIEDHKINGVFVVTNKSNKSIYYGGFDKNSNVNTWINQYDNTESAMPIFCAFGLKLQELKPNETAKFEIPIPNNGRPFEAGFDFKKSKKGYWETVWVKPNEEAIFTTSP